MRDTADSKLDLEQYLDKEVGPYQGWDPVNPAMIRHWCDALGDFNPIYTDAAVAERVHGGIVAPPAMLQAWIMRGYSGEQAPGSTAENSFYLLQVLEEAGYPAVVAVNCEQQYLHYLKVGDDVRSYSRLESISEQKTTALGVGFFVTELSEYFNQRDEKVAVMRFRVFKYRPHPQADRAGAPPLQTPPAAQRMRPVRSHDTAFFWDGVDAGRLLVQRCQACGTLRHPAAPMCPHCQSLEWDTIEASGRGTVYSYVVMHHPPIPPFDYPNVVALVELEEGTRLVTQLIGAKPEDVRIDMAVEVVFEEVENGLTLPQFRPRPVAG